MDIFLLFHDCGKTKKRIAVWGRGGDDLGELGAARPAERPKFRPDFGLGDPAMCVKLVPKVCTYFVKNVKNVTDMAINTD